MRWSHSESGFLSMVDVVLEYPQGRIAHSSAEMSPTATGKADRETRLSCLRAVTLSGMQSWDELVKGGSREGQEKAQEAG